MAKKQSKKAVEKKSNNKIKIDGCPSPIISDDKNIDH